MSTRFILWIVALGGLLVATGCEPMTRDYYYRSPAYHGGSTPYYSGFYGSGTVYEPYYEPYYVPYGSRSYYGPYRSHEREHEILEHKYDKAMNRLDRQEREAEAKLARRYGGNPVAPRFQEQQQRIDQRYAYKRGKVERNLAKEHREYHSGW